MAQECFKTEGVIMQYRLESDVDMLKAEVQSMQAAMQQTTHSQGLRQSLRTAERLSRAATPGIPRQSSSQCNSTIAAQTPERDPEPRVRPHPPRHALPHREPPSFICRLCDKHMGGMRRSFLWPPEMFFRGTNSSGQTCQHIASALRWHSI